MNNVGSTTLLHPVFNHLKQVIIFRRVRVLITIIIKIKIIIVLIKLTENMILDDVIELSLALLFTQPIVIGLKIFKM